MIMLAFKICMSNNYCNIVEVKICRIFLLLHKLIYIQSQVYCLKLWNKGTWNIVSLNIDNMFTGMFIIILFNLYHIVTIR